MSSVSSAETSICGSRSCGSVFTVRNKRTSDNALIDRAKQGEVSAFQELVERYQQRVHAVAMGVSGSFHEAEDITQEAFLKAFRNLSSFRKASSFYTWVYRIAYNLSIDQKRKRYRYAESSVGDAQVLDMLANNMSVADGEQERPDSRLERTELGEQLSVAIESLSPEHRAVVLLREVEGLSYAEISEVVGCSKGTVMSRLHHARKRLQQRLIGVVGFWKKDVDMDVEEHKRSMEN